MLGYVLAFSIDKSSVDKYVTSYPHHCKSNSQS